MRAKMQAELREQLDALQISMEAEARRADAAAEAEELLRVQSTGHSVARALERPASGFSACRECCVSICLVDGCGGGLLVAFGYKFTELRITLISAVYAQ
ncbi:hypothetical protein EMIHUDRAFT_213065 [Emiliania huxleyi CCMP1516]|uniref:Uncharacterized protein n=2 Tax=Emiliania huxleyi TaxID=2903 RepID=A0A0D3INM0_EMIH1|nr:hypothetical protein EMIHUDRAFT_213065 [Emiliania huxleyi CCMP1516]EOD12855.1 hypothetical protein EMIHUDRAFT_213065 [Emiliania huxleyi CCMP1516]|eukprot:XP_005765284.1 hypothetical protein EMIHUDRAFT_213065 [Emiliania huxleyi CCMP1516]